MFPGNLGRLRGQVALAAVMLSTLGGCSFSDVVLQAPLRSSVSTESHRGKGRPIVIAKRFSDNRPRRAECGIKKNGYNSEVAKIRCDESPDHSLAALLAAELATAGFQVIPAARAEPTTLFVSGALTQYFVEPKNNFFGGSYETDIGLRLIVESKAGFYASRRFFVKGDEATYWGSDADLQASNDRAVRQLLLATVGALANLMDQQGVTAAQPAAPAAVQAPPFANPMPGTAP